MVQWSLYGLLTILAKTHIIVPVTTFLLILYTRSIHFIYFVVGSCLNTLFAKGLKRCFRQSRPYGQPGYGMPSTHSQAIMFFAVYFHCVASNPWLANGVTLFALAVVWSRVQLKHHTVSQVLVGSLFGALTAVLWYTAWLSGFKSLLLQLQNDRLPLH
ncbi:phosphatidic acid phosphatase type 2/haloperoxidase [Chlamydoabsidia padenii]|nr:phosphatidic acid phosphatase type 2/haloperoxidase [Chlamydoabsidia padenii]